MADNQPEQADPEVLWLPVTWILAHYRPIEGPTWERTRAIFESAHTHLDVLRDDIAEHGVKTPVELNPVERFVHRGHHRLLLAADAGVAHVPAVFAWRNETTYWNPDTRQDLPDDFDDFDDDEPPSAPWIDTVYPIPADARAAAQPRP